ncbi:hypothetical protein BSKO_10283 [Bryopsis sp. KO-2023]|nr:hypothetical protein BSKO_10283 [Bryopsis sp. KO-2023]
MESSLRGEKFDKRVPIVTTRPDHSSVTSTSNNNAESPKSAGLALPRRSKPMLKSQKLFEHGLMARILPKGDEEMLGNLASMDSLDSHLQSFCLSSLTLNSWLGESLDPTLTVESFGLSMNDTISRDLPREDRMRSIAASSLDFGNALVSVEQSSRDLTDDPEDLSIAQTREEFVHPELVSLEPQSTLHSQTYSEQENISIKQTGHEFAELELLPSQNLGQSFDTEQTVLIDTEPCMTVAQSSQEYSDLTQSQTGSASVTSPNAEESIGPDEASQGLCHPRHPKKKMGVIKRLICGCSSRNRKKWTDKDVRNIVERHHSRKLDRATVDSARDDSDDSLDSHLLGQRSVSRIPTSEFEKSKSMTNGRGSALGAGVHKDRGRERHHHSVSSLEQARLRRMLKDSNLKEHAPRFVWKSMPTLAKFELSDMEWARYWRFNGTWTLDRELSDRQDGSIAYVWQLTAALRRTIDGLDRLLIDSTPRLCRTSLSASTVRGIQEQRPWSGDIVRCERRDGRSGFMMIWVEPTQKSFTARMEWGEPYPGHAAETYELSKDGQLLFVIREIQRRDKSEIRAQIRSVFRRQA